MTHVSFTYLIVLMLSGCGTIKEIFFKNKQPDYENIEKVTDTGYLEHINTLGNFFLQLEEKKILNLSTSSQNYVNGILKNLLNSNELSFKSNSQNFKILILSNSKVFHFSLPNRKIVLSTGLIKKYLNNESLLASVLSFELNRSANSIYPKKTIIPTGAISITQLMLFMRLPVREKVEMHKWAHYMMKRSGFDGDYYLSWLQIQNRNANDFIYNQGDYESISKEEFLFKGHLIKTMNTKKNSKKITNSKEYYYFLEEIGKVADEI